MVYLLKLLFLEFRLAQPFGSNKSLLKVDLPTVIIQRETLDAIGDAGQPELSFPYLPASVLMAQGNIETAVEDFLNVISPMLDFPNDNTGCISFLLQQVR